MKYWGLLRWLIKKIEEVIELQRQQDIAIFYLRGVLDAKDQVL